MKKWHLIRFLMLALIPVPLLNMLQTVSTDVAAYQLGVVAEALPGAEINYVITITNRGPTKVGTFYILDGWTINSAGTNAFASPLADPVFGKYTLAGKWIQELPDQEIVAWLLKGDLQPGETVQFNWKIRINPVYRGELVNWAAIQIDGVLKGAWNASGATQPKTPPVLASAPDSEQDNNRTPDGVTLVTDAPRGKGVDLAVFQTGLLSRMTATTALDSSWLIANRGPEAIKQYYLMAGWSLDANANSLLALPIPEPNFGSVRVLGRWQQKRLDEEVWLWLLEGAFPPGSSAFVTWKRTLNPIYRGDMVNWAKVLTAAPPDGQWTVREGTTSNPTTLSNPAEIAPDNNRTVDLITTITD